MCPCDGIAVMIAQLVADQEFAATEIVELLRSYGLQAEPRKDAQGIIRMRVNLAGLPVKVAIEPGGKVTAVTQGGTFAQGKKALEKLVVQALKARGVKMGNVKFETHVHAQGRAPRLAYNAPLRA